MKLKGFIELFHEQGMEDTSLWAFQSTEPEHYHTELVDDKCPWDADSVSCPVVRGFPEHATYEGLFILKNGDKIQIDGSRIAYNIKLVKNDHTKPPYEGPTYLVEGIPYTWWDRLAEKKIPVWFIRDEGGNYQI